MLRRRCCWVLAPTTVHRYLPPTWHSAKNPQHTAAVVEWQDRQTDRWTLDHFIDPAPHTMRAVSVNVTQLTIIKYWQTDWHQQRRHLHSIINMYAKDEWIISVYKQTSKSKASRSIGIVYFRAKFCITPVRNAWVKKKPEIQNTLGLSFSNQFCKQQNDQFIYPFVCLHFRAIAEQ